MEQQYKVFIDKLKSFRISLAKTQIDVAALAKLSVRTVSNIENYENVSLINLLSYLNALGLLQEFYNFPPIADMRFEDIPRNKNERKRVRGNKHKKIIWGEDKR